MAERKRKKRSILSFFPKGLKGETTESSTKLSEEGPSQSKSNQSDPQSRAAVAESDRDKPKTSEKESSQINRGFQESKNCVVPRFFQLSPTFWRVGAKTGIPGLNAGIMKIQNICLHAEIRN